ncbi:polysaccharide chain length determinant protein (PEP-CTERM system associated) [Aliiruegeria haliotis]|uniref:Polysaccharide chain length determinant protein (PEP-CTERM system associated) n=1 Tax=Aliiruegeria haliotis TaxID=1280846 RepID=A0A2T0RSS1_9RHOB|nr:hypothetical protein [Aliiruegeria haliotis]PRY24234.1 polysaccharide chain length determinant protein (PEP-CTERM system associated) [Aliiruegeria haliotis]
MTDLSYYASRFARRFPWFLIVAMSVTTFAVGLAMTLPPVYRGEFRVVVESKQIPDRLAESTAYTPAPEQLQLIEQRLLTRGNLLDIAATLTAVRDQEDLTPGEIVSAMRANTTLRRSSGRDLAAVMKITYDAPTPEAASAVLNAYLTFILQRDAERRTERAVSTLEFFEQQVARLGEELEKKSAQILAFKTSNSDNLPETLDFRMSRLARLEERVSRGEAEIADRQTQRDQVIRMAELADRLESSAAMGRRQISPREARLEKVHAELDAALTVYSEQSPQVQRLRSHIAQIEGTLDAEAAVRAREIASATGAETAASDPLVAMQVREFDDEISILSTRNAELEAEVTALQASIARTPANRIVLDGLLRDLRNIQDQYNTAVDRVSRASTGERIELLSHGQRITVVEPPVEPTKPVKPNRFRLVLAGLAAGIAAGLGLVFLIESINRSPRRPDDIVAQFDVMPIATIPYIRSRQQAVADRGAKLLTILAILVGVPAVLYLVHDRYIPLEVAAQTFLDRFGMHW